MRNSIDLIFSWIVTIIVIVINIITYILFRKQEQYHIAEGEMKNQLKEYEYQKLTLRTGRAASAGNPKDSA